MLPVSAIHTAKVTAEIANTTGTNTPATLSAMRAMGALVALASSTSWMILASDVSAPTRVARKGFTPAGMTDVKIYTELGRYMLAPYGALISKVIHEKHTFKDYIGLDACACNLMRPAMYGAYHHITVLGKEHAPLTHLYDVTGSLCENNDKFAVDRKLPEIEIGDYVCIHDTGAHGHSMGYNYNGKLRSAELLLHEDGSVSMIRRAETPRDYFATFDFCDILKNMNY